MSNTGRSYSNRWANCPRSKKCALIYEKEITELGLNLRKADSIDRDRAHRGLTQACRSNCDATMMDKVIKKNIVEEGRKKEEKGKDSKNNQRIERFRFILDNLFTLVSFLPYFKTLL